MNAKPLMFLVLLLSAIGVSVVPTHAMCPGPLTLEAQFAGSQAVFLGRAIAQQIVPTRAGSGAETRATETTFEVEELWKGQATARTLRVQTCGWHDDSQSVTCSEGFRFVVGSRYVVFAIADPLETSGCEPTASVERAEATLQWLSGKPRK
jgi:hypothetical protein